MTIKLKEIRDKMIHNMDKQGEDFGDKGEDCPVCEENLRLTAPSAIGTRWPRAHTVPSTGVDHTRTGSCIYAHDEWVRSQVLKQRKEEEEKS